MDKLKNTIAQHSDYIAEVRKLGADAQDGTRVAAVSVEAVAAAIRDVKHRMDDPNAQNVLSAATAMLDFVAFELSTTGMVSAREYDTIVRDRLEDAMMWFDATPRSFAERVAADAV